MGGRRVTVIRHRCLLARKVRVNQLVNLVQEAVYNVPTVECDSSPCVYFELEEKSMLASLGTAVEVQMCRLFLRSSAHEQVLKFIAPLFGVRVDNGDARGSGPIWQSDACNIALLVFLQW